MKRKYKIVLCFYIYLMIYCVFSLFDRYIVRNGLLDFNQYYLMLGMGFCDIYVYIIYICYFLKLCV